MEDKLEKERIEEIVKDVKELADGYSSKTSEVIKTALSAIKEIVDLALIKPDK